MADTRPLTFDDLFSIERIAQPTVSPDGRRLAFVTARHDAKANKVVRTIREVDLDTRDQRELTPGPGNHSSPAYSPDGQWLAFVSNRDTEQGDQVWLLPIAGGEARMLTRGHGGASALAWSPDSSRIAFVRTVVVSPDYDEADDEVDPAKGPDGARVYGLPNGKSSARIADALLFRHWDSWKDRRRSHVHVVDVATGEIADVTPGDWDSPPISLGSDRDHDWAPDGRGLVFVANPDALVAHSTNNSIYLVDIDGIRAIGAPRRLSVTDACDNHPRFAPDGRTIVYIGMERPLHEADATRFRVHDLSTGTTRALAEDIDRDPHSFDFSGGDVVFLAQDRGRQSVYRMDLSTGAIRQLTSGTWNGMLCAVPGGRRLVVGRQDVSHPMDLWLLRPGDGAAPETRNGPVPDLATGTEAVRLTELGEVLSGVTLHPAEELWYTGADDTTLHGFVVKPPQYVEGQRYPLILLIHGGPQGAFSDDFHYRWNAQMFAAQGAVVAFLNPRGSTGYGRRITDEISGDWGGRCYDDIMLGVDALLERYSFIDPARVAAAGGSFGGFMVNWIQGHTDRFKALVCHDGIFMAENMAWTTEELWFDSVEYQGMPHENRDLYEKWSPHQHVADFKTPMLVIHGEQDFRCPISEGIGMFTALQVMGVPSRLVVFPDEGHWVTKPANAEVWYHEAVGWLMKHLQA